MKVKKTILIIILICIILFTMWISVAGDLSNISYYLDVPSLLFIILPTSAMLAFSDLFKDYGRAYKIVWGNLEYTTKEIKASLEALSLSIKLVTLSGISGIIIGLVSILEGAVNYPNAVIYASSAVMLLTGLYAILINLIQYAMKSKLTKELIYREN